MNFKLTFRVKIVSYVSHNIRYLIQTHEHIIKLLMHSIIICEFYSIVTNDIFNQKSVPRITVYRGDSHSYGKLISNTHLFQYYLLYNFPIE